MMRKLMALANDAEHTARSMRGVEKILGADKSKSASGPTQGGYR